MWGLCAGEAGSPRRVRRRRTVVYTTALRARTYNARNQAICTVLLDGERRCPAATWAACGGPPKRGRRASPSAIRTPEMARRRRGACGVDGERRAQSLHNYRFFQLQSVRYFTVYYNVSSLLHTSHRCLPQRNTALLVAASYERVRRYPSRAQVAPRSPISILCTRALCTPCAARKSRARVFPRAL